MRTFQRKWEYLPNLTDHLCVSGHLWQMRGGVDCRPGLTWVPCPTPVDGRLVNKLFLSSLCVEPCAMVCGSPASFMWSVTHVGNETYQLLIMVTREFSSFRVKIFLRACSKLLPPSGRSFFTQSFSSWRLRRKIPNHSALLRCQAQGKHELISD